MLNLKNLIVKRLSWMA